MASDTDDEAVNKKIGDWGKKVAAHSEITVLSGFQSTGERRLLDEILKGKASAVILLARCLFKKCPEEYLEAVKQKRLLIVSVTDDEKAFKVDYERAYERNKRVVAGGKKVVVGYVKKGGMVEKVLADSEKPYISL